MDFFLKSLSALLSIKVSCIVQYLYFIHPTGVCFFFFLDGRVFSAEESKS